mmetsp:Transcript_85103/g.241410  ORF Transcript_85103/g.241410 Transcript_85103/m.241410 type:complete len:130 (+) Transcript_85103:2-391(+)
MAAGRRATIDASQEINGVTWYTIKLTEEGVDSFYKKRYSDFHSFDRRARPKSVLLSQVLPKLPERGIIGLRHQFDVGSFNAKRKEGLQKYITALTSNVAGHELKDFLGEGVLQESSSLSTISDSFASAA